MLRRRPAPRPALCHWHTGLALVLLASCACPQGPIGATEATAGTTSVSAASESSAGESSGPTSGPVEPVCKIKIYAWQPSPPGLGARPRMKIEHAKCSEAEVAARVQAVQMHKDGTVSDHTAVFDFGATVAGGPLDCAVLHWSPLLAGVPSSVSDDGWSLTAPADLDHEILHEGFGGVWTATADMLFTCPGGPVPHGYPHF